MGVWEYGTEYCVQPVYIGFLKFKKYYCKNFSSYKQHLSGTWCWPRPWLRNFIIFFRMEKLIFSFERGMNNCLTAIHIFTRFWFGIRKKIKIETFFACFRLYAKKSMIKLSICRGFLLPDCWLLSRVQENRLVLIKTHWVFYLQKK